MPPTAAAMNRLSEKEKGKKHFEETSLTARAEENTSRGILEDLRPDQLGDTYSSFTFAGLPTLEEKRYLEPFLPASNGGVTNSMGAVKRDICELPSLDLSLLPPRESMGAGSFTCRHKGRPTPSAQQSNNAGAEQPAVAQLTIFYAGRMNVYNVSADKAKAIMMVASRICGSPDSATPSSSSTPSTPLQSTPRRTEMSPMSASPSPVTILSHNVSSQPIKTADLQITKKCCIQRFLEKRNERIHGKSPYLPPAQN